MRVRRSPQLGYRGGGTLVAIIDTGIKLNDSLFYMKMEVQRLFLCGIRATRGTRPVGFLYGTEWTREEINNILRVTWILGASRKDEKND